MSSTETVSFELTIGWIREGPGTVTPSFSYWISMPSGWLPRVYPGSGRCGWIIRHWVSVIWFDPAPEVIVAHNS